MTRDDDPVVPLAYLREQLDARDRELANLRAQRDAAHSTIERMLGITIELANLRAENEALRRANADVIRMDITGSAVTEAIAAERERWRERVVETFVRCIDAAVRLDDDNARCVVEPSYARGMLAGMAIDLDDGDWAWLPELVELARERWLARRVGQPTH